MKSESSTLPSDFYGRAFDTSPATEADPADTASIEGIVAALYASISGPAGQPPNWQRMRSLSLPEARSIRTGKLADGSRAYKVMSTEEYIRQMDTWLTENGFYETEIHRVMEQYGCIAHVFSTYESRRNAEDRVPFLRGINMFQLLYDGSRWWIMNVLWQHESAEHPIPAKYLPL